MTKEDLVVIKKLLEERNTFGKPNVIVNMTEYDWKLWFFAPKYILLLIEEVEKQWARNSSGVT